MTFHLPSGSVRSVLAITNPLAWVVIALFAAGVLAMRYSKRRGRILATTAWLTFGVFWWLLVPHFAFVQKSYIETAGTVLAGPACVYAGYLTWQDHPGLHTVTRAVAITGLIYVPVLTVRPLQAWLIESTARNVNFLVTSLGYNPGLILGEQGFRNTFQYYTPSGHRFLVRVILACTGIGSMSLMAGLVSSVDAPLSRKLKALGIVVPVIYLANILRVAFIGLASGNQWLQVAPRLVMTLFGTTDPYAVSYYLSDRVISQSLSVVVLVGLLVVLFRVLPELAEVLEDVIEAATGSRYDIRTRLAT